MKKTSVLPALAFAASCALFGCEHADSVKGVSWNGKSEPAPAASTTPAASGGESAAGSHAGDAVSFSSLRWSFGGVNGSGASQSGVVISGLSCSKGGLSFRYNTNLSAWGRSNGVISDYACMFVKKSDGTWVGGKFDWISSSRTTRDFVNVRSGYNGWSLSGVPNPCQVAFLILNHDCRRRSNVITGTWAR